MSHRYLTRSKKKPKRGPLLTQIITEDGDLLITPRKKRKSTINVNINDNGKKKITQFQEFALTYLEAMNITEDTDFSKYKASELKEAISLIGFTKSGVKKDLVTFMEEETEKLFAAKKAESARVASIEEIETDIESDTDPDMIDNKKVQSTVNEVVKKTPKKRKRKKIQPKKKQSLVEKDLTTELLETSVEPVKRRGRGRQKKVQRETENSNKSKKGKSLEKLTKEIPKKSIETKKSITESKRKSIQLSKEKETLNLENNLSISAKRSAQKSTKKKKVVKESTKTSKLKSPLPKKIQNALATPQLSNILKTPVKSKAKEKISVEILKDQEKESNKKTKQTEGTGNKKENYYKMESVPINVLQNASKSTVEIEFDDLGEPIETTRELFLWKGKDIEIFTLKELKEVGKQIRVLISGSRQVVLDRILIRLDEIIDFVSINFPKMSPIKQENERNSASTPKPKAVTGLDFNTLDTTVDTSSVGVEFDRQSVIGTQIKEITYSSKKRRRSVLLDKENIDLESKKQLNNEEDESLGNNFDKSSFHGRQMKVIAETETQSQMDEVENNNSYEAIMNLINKIRQTRDFTKQEEVELLTTLNEKKQMCLW